MKTLVLLISILTTVTAMGQSSIHEFSFKLIDGSEKSFADFKGKPLMIVNVASECGYTKQYEQLQEVHEKYGDKIVLIGFPANNFGGQEPGTNEEIQNFCKKNFGVTFLMAEKVSVKGKEIAPVFKWLTVQEGASFDGSIRWNFEKFILNGDGKLVERFRSGTLPNDEEVLKALGL